MNQRNYKTKRDHVNVGELMAKARAKSGLTQRAVSKQLGYGSAQFVSNLERGISLMPLRKMSKIIQIYGLNPNAVVSAIMVTKEKEIRKGLGA